MAKVKFKNGGRYAIAIQVVGGSVTIPAGKSKSIEKKDLHAISDDKLDRLHDLGVEITGLGRTAPSADEKEAAKEQRAADDAEKEKLIAALWKLGIRRDKRTPINALRAELDRATKAAADNPADNGGGENSEENSEDADSTEENADAEEDTETDNSDTETDEETDPPASA